MKTADERGHPAAQWLVDARAAVKMSVSDVLGRLKRWDETTLRKAEAHSDNISRPLWRTLVPFYQSVAVERGVILAPPPVFEPARKTPESDVKELVRDVRELVAELQAARLAQPDIEDVIARSVSAALQAVGERATS